MTLEISGSELITALARRRSGDPADFVLLTGAGASVEAGLPTGSGVVANLLERAWRETGHNNSCKNLRIWAKQRFSWYRKWALDPGALSEYETVIDQLLLSQDERTTYFEGLDEAAALERAEGNAHLVELIRRGIFRTILTTNFNTVLSRLYRTPLPDFSATGQMIDMDPCSDQPRIVRIHGELAHRNVANTRADMNEFSAARFRAVLRLLESHGLVTIGYAGADLRLMRELFGGIESRHTRKGLFWCIRNGEQPSEPLKRFLSRGLNGVRLVRIGDFTQFMTELACATAHLRSREDIELRAKRVNGLFFRIAEATQDGNRLNRQVLETLVNVTGAKAGYLKVRDKNAIRLGTLTGEGLSRMRELRRRGTTGSERYEGASTVQVSLAGSLSTIGLFGPNLDLDTDDGRVFRAILAFLHAKSQ